MRKIKFINHMVLCVAAIVTTSCGDLLDLAPIDNYGSGNFWKTEAQVSAYVDGLHDALRAKAGQHVITFGELRGGALQGWCKSRWTDYFQRCNYFTEFIQRDSWS